MKNPSPKALLPLSMPDMLFIKKEKLNVPIIACSISKEHHKINDK